MIKRYTVTITEYGEEEKNIGGRWEKGGDGNPEEYGHTPDRLSVVLYDRVVYEQTVMDLDVPALVAVVNKA